MTSETSEAGISAALEADQAILLWAAQPALVAPLHAALQERYPVTLVEELPKDLARGKAILVLVVPSPVEALCEALQAGYDVDTSLVRVQAQLSEVLALQRSRRCQVHLLEQAVLYQAPEQILAYFDLPVAASPVAASPVAASADLQAVASDSPDPVMLALAHTRIQADPVLRRLAGEFMASGRLLVGGDPVERMNEALMSRLDDQEKLEEVNLLQLQQRSMYEQLEATYGEKQQLEQRLLSRSEVLQVTGRMLQEEEQKAAHQARALAEAERELQRLYNSRSFRLMAPLRWLRRVLRGGA